MRRKFISKIILGTMISTTLCTLVPVKASAEWGKDYQNNWYYTQNNEKMIGWKRIDGQLYYFDNNGKMQTGWIKAGTSWYFLQNNGTLKIGWINYNKNLYYADSSGAIQTGTINIAGKVYIFDNNGVAKTSNTVINGQFLTIGSDGEVVGMQVPTPDKELDASGNVVTVLKNTDNNSINSPTDSKVNDVIKDQSISDDDPNEGRTFKVRFKDSNGAELKTQSIKNGKSVDLYQPTKVGYIFGSWNTKSDGSGKSYAQNDNIKVKEDINLYAQWTDDTAIYVDSITVKGSSYVTINKTSQMTAEMSPSDAVNPSVTWSVTDGTGKATIDSNGVLTGVANGTVTVKATTKDGVKISGMKEVTVSATDVLVPVDKITITSTSGDYEIKTNAGTLQMQGSVSPEDANNPEITWSIVSIDGTANIDSKTGSVIAKSNGSVKVIATTSNGTSAEKVIKISGQLLSVLVDSVTVSGKGGATKIETDAAAGGTNGTLQMIANVLPTSASNKGITWSVNDPSIASIDPSTGLLTAKINGKVIVTAATKDGSGKVGTQDIEIKGQTIRVTDVTVSGNDITEDGKTSQMSANLIPDTGSYKSLTWSVENKTGSADISATGVLKAKSNGEVDVVATIIAKDGSKKVGRKTITLSNQTAAILVTSIVVATKNNEAFKITTDDGTLEMIATLLPSYATSTTPGAVNWEVINGTGSGKIIGNSNGNAIVLQASATGIVKVRATYSKDGVTVSKEVEVIISGQIEQATEVIIDTPDNSKVENQGTLQMSAHVLPTNASNKNVRWEVSNGTGEAIFSNATGLLKGTKAGTVKVRAISMDKYGATSEQKIITVVEPKKITGITLTASPIAITQNAGYTILTASIDNDDATNKAVIWTVDPYKGDTGTEIAGSATIVDNGDLTAKLTAITNGLVKVKATAKDTGGFLKEIVIQISGQRATSFTIKGYNGTTETNQIDSINGILKMGAFVVPISATSPSSVTWSVDKPAIATIDADGTLHGVSNGDVIVTATDSFGVYGTTTIKVNGVTGIGINQSSTAIVVGTPVTLTAVIDPTVAATNKKVTWSVNDGTKATLYADSGKLTATLTPLVKGNIDVTVTVDDGSGISHTKTIIIS